jgi:hypothetical protein
MFLVFFLFILHERINMGYCTGAGAVGEGGGTVQAQERMGKESSLILAAFDNRVPCPFVK